MSIRDKLKSRITTIETGVKIGKLSNYTIDIVSVENISEYTSTIAGIGSVLGEK